MVKKRVLHPKPVFDENCLYDFLDEYDVKRIWAGKIWKYLLDHPGATFDDIPELPARLLEPLKDQFDVCTSTVIKTLESEIDHTIKILLRLQDGHEVEAVIINHTGDQSRPDRAQSGQRTTLCVSSQIGCKMGCTFCATGTLGLTGNLYAGEILEQMVHARRLRPDVVNVVFMGMGEPLENYDGVRGAIRGFIDPQRFSVPSRGVTVSTVGVTSVMRRLIKDHPQIKLALSLHAATQEVREQIVPSAKNFQLAELMAVLDEYSAAVPSDGKRKGMVMIEYVMIKGVNDTNAQATALAKLIKGRPVTVNLIPYNPFEGNVHNYESPDEDVFRHFTQTLLDADVRVFERRHHGRDIAAACGQLAKISVESKKIDEIEQIGAIEAPLRAPANATCTLMTEGKQKSDSGLAARLLRHKWQLAVPLCAAATVVVALGVMRSKK